VEASLRTRPLTSAVNAPCFFSAALPEASFQTLPLEGTSTSPIATCIAVTASLSFVCAHFIAATYRRDLQADTEGDGKPGT